jgi:mannose-6-phosphate isomerase-like protein (cupin superfamily)
MNPEQIVHKDEVFAIILYGSFNEPGIHFFTPNSYSQQMAYMRHPEGKKIQPHIHNSVPRSVQYTCEVLFLKSGRMRVDFYGEDRVFFTARELNAGDTILLIKGGHGFQALTEIEMIEVKQGPYAGDHDKTRFEV